MTAADAFLIRVRVELYTAVQTLDPARLRELRQLLAEVSAIATATAGGPTAVDAGPEPAAMVTIRRAVESCEALALDDESDREVLIGRLARGLGIAFVVALALAGCGECETPADAAPTADACICPPSWPTCPAGCAPPDGGLP